VCLATLVRDVGTGIVRIRLRHRSMLGLIQDVQRQEFRR
jgi:hypothetical protein